MSDARALILALPYPVILIGRYDRIIAVNAAARTLIGLNAEGMPYITALRQPALLDAIEATLNDGGQRTTTYLSKEGARDTTWEVSVQGVDVSDGPAVVMSFQDQTAQQEAGEMRRDFVANVSHELRTPLTSVQGFIETLRGPAKDDPEARDRFLGIVGQEAERMHRLVEDLLSLSRVEAEERVRPTATLTVQTVIDDVLDALTPMAAANDVSFLRDLPDAPIEIVADATQLWQVLRNLLENAVKYGRAQGTVTISLSKPTHQPALLQTGIVISVKDDGNGIAPHHIARLTERFYRVDDHRNRDVGGTGLGLAIVKHIISRHRGRMRIESRVGEGTEFKLILPVSQTQVTE